jgi:hypothetical protein
MFPISGAAMEADAHFRALLNVSVGVPSKGVLLQGPLHGIPHSEMSHHYSPPSFIYQSPPYMSFPHIPVPLGWKGAPMERDARTTLHYS